MVHCFRLQTALTSGRSHRRLANETNLNSQRSIRPAPFRGDGRQTALVGKTQASAVCQRESKVSGSTVEGRRQIDLIVVERNDGQRQLGNDTPDLLDVQPAAGGDIDDLREVDRRDEARKDRLDELASGLTKQPGEDGRGIQHRQVALSPLSIAL
jgi:hypothetical protein